MADSLEVQFDTAGSEITGGIPRTEKREKSPEGSWGLAPALFRDEFGYLPEDFKELEISPISARAALQEIREGGFFDIVAPSVKRAHISSVTEDGVETIDALPAGTVFGLDQTSLETMRKGFRDVVFFKKLSDGTLQPLHTPGVIRQPKELDVESLPESGGGIADTVINR